MQVYTICPRLWQVLPVTFDVYECPVAAIVSFSVAPQTVQVRTLEPALVQVASVVTQLPKLWLPTLLVTSPIRPHVVHPLTTFDATVQLVEAAPTG